LHSVKLQSSKKHSPLSLTAYSFWLKEKKKEIQRHGFVVKLCGNTVAKFELKWLKTR